MTEKQQGVKGKGGAGRGQGRHHKFGKGASTKVMRIPEAYVEEVEALLAHLEATKELARHHDPALSDPLFMRSRSQDNAQWLYFITQPLKMGKQTPYIEIATSTHLEE
ncbi:hypothetical protein F9L16_04575 [Agarivorans sp. B2Z047]|uniref:hypothetical protein n=1 Tax=Agarivorans sp. B2Z047 TaxID=2652721 RepID=UPI00128B42B3|nr:hypothetical protein [Agarivorans sp. B2Z047]MPW28274.1 hypothetical protein [Agarivorans sp. B2Z047]UQN43898.1 hypothetical protein LQZ07_05365 [Agarivorans sp. B2Z047]